MPVCQNNLIVFGNALFKRPLVRRSRFLPDPSFGRPSSLVFRPSSVPVPSLPSFLSSPLSCFFSLLSYAPFCISPCLLSPRPPPLRVTPLRTSSLRTSPLRASPALYFPFGPFPPPCPSALPVKSHHSAVSDGQTRKKTTFRAKKGPKSFFGKNAMKNCNFRARVL